MSLMANFKAQRALSFQAKGRTEEALALYDRAYEEGMNQPRHLLAYATLIIRNGQYEKAKELLLKTEKAPGITPDQKRQLFMDYAVCCYKLGEIDKGIRLLERQHQRQPSGLIYETLGYLYVEKYDLTHKPSLEAWLAMQPKPEQPDFGKGLHWNVYAAAGVHSCPVELDAVLQRAGEGGPLPKDSTVPSRVRLLLGAELSWRYTPIFATGVGAELGYNANNYRETDLILEGREDPRGYSPLRAGLYLIQEFRYRQVAAHIIWGAYLFKRTGLTEDVGRTFQKIGVRYRFGRTGFYAGLDMRAHSFDRSYCLEWSAGCSF